MSDLEDSTRIHWLVGAFFWWMVILAFIIFTSAMLAALSFVAVVTTFYWFGEGGSGMPSWFSALYAVILVVVGWALAAAVGRRGARFASRRGWVSRPWWVSPAVAVGAWLVLDIAVVVYFVVHQQGFAGGALMFGVAATAAVLLMWGQRDSG